YVTRRNRDRDRRRSGRGDGGQPRSREAVAGTARRAHAVPSGKDRRAHYRRQAQRAVRTGDEVEVRLGAGGRARGCGATPDQLLAPAPSPQPKKKESADKPGSVVGNHSSGTYVTARL